MKLPYAEVEETTPPSTEHFLLIVKRLSKRLRLPAVFLEQTAARVAELRVGVRRTSTCRARGSGRAASKAGAAPRVIWRRVPVWLMEVLLESVPPDDRTPERRLFAGLNEGDDAGRDRPRLSLSGHPRSTRHTIWATPARLARHAGGMPARARGADGAHKASMSLDVYTHVMPPDEVDVETLVRAT